MADKAAAAALQAAQQLEEATLGHNAEVSAASADFRRRIAQALRLDAELPRPGGRLQRKRWSWKIGSFRRRCHDLQAKVKKLV